MTQIKLEDWFYNDRSSYRIELPRFAGTSNILTVTTNDVFVYLRRYQNSVVANYTFLNAGTNPRATFTVQTTDDKGRIVLDRNDDNLWENVVAYERYYVTILIKSRASVRPIARANLDAGAINIIHRTDN